MNTNYAISRISSKRKGQFFKISYISDVPMTAKAKREGHIVLKYTYATVRHGINYSHLKTVKEREAHLDIPAIHELPWGQWDPKHPGLVINHKEKQYIRFYSSPNKSKSTYYLDGTPISKEELMETGFVLNSYWNKTENHDCFTIKAENIQDIF